MEENRDFVYKLAIIEQQVQQLQQQLQAVEQGIIDLNSLNFELDELVGSKEKDILSPIGRGIFTHTKLVSEDLIVNVGKGCLVKKSIPETKELIKRQIENLDKVRRELNENLDDVGVEFEKVIQEADQKRKG